MSQSITHYDSPIGAIEIHATDTAVSRVEYAGEQVEADEEETRRDEASRASSSLPSGAHPLLEEVQGQLAAYFAGALHALRPAPGPGRHAHFSGRSGSSFSVSAYGETASYQAIADAIDNPKAVRAVGAANGRNPVAIIVPCHRIIGSGGRPKLTGYGGGLWRKEWLLRHEGFFLV